MSKRKSKYIVDDKVNEQNLNREIRSFEGVVVRYGFSDLIYYSCDSLVYRVNLYEAIIGFSHACLVHSESLLPDSVKDAINSRALAISQNIFYFKTLKEAQKFFVKLSVM